VSSALISRRNSTAARAIPTGALQCEYALGGSTGVQLVKDPATGRRYVDKRGASPGHLLEESAADRAYEAMGVPVAPHVVIDTPSGPLKRARYQDGAVDLPTFLRAAPTAEADAVTSQLQDGLALDALLGNWDVVGLAGDNILVRNGVAIRIDNGGSLRYRARGAPKGDQWSDKVTELARFRDTSNGSWVSRVHGGVTDARARQQVLELDAKREALLAALPAEVRGRVGKRLDDMLEQTSKVSNVTDAPMDMTAEVVGRGVEPDGEARDAAATAWINGGAIREVKRRMAETGATEEDALRAIDLSRGSRAIRMSIGLGYPSAHARVLLAELDAAQPAGPRLYRGVVRPGLAVAMLEPGMSLDFGMSSWTTSRRVAINYADVSSDALLWRMLERHEPIPQRPVGVVFQLERGSRAVRLADLVMEGTMLHRALEHPLEVDPLDQSRKLRRPLHAFEYLVQGTFEVTGFSDHRSRDPRLAVTLVGLRQVSPVQETT
jgi:hypothetical protein